VLSYVGFVGIFVFGKLFMKLEWGRKISCPACALHLYDMMKNPIACPYCGNVFYDGNDAKSKRRTTSTELEIDNTPDSDESVVLEGEDMNTDVEVIKLKDLE
jgi:uncharacterized protein (TIGR02300 family)